MVALVRQNSVQQLEQSTQLTTRRWLVQLFLSLPPQQTTQTLSRDFLPLETLVCKVTSFVTFFTLGFKSLAKFFSNFKTEPLARV